MVIDETSAWAILKSYVQDCLAIDSASLIAVYATGSLGGGYYRPGQSDIDAVLIVTNGSEHIWGNNETCSTALSALNSAYKQRYTIPKDFGPFALQISELYPPYPARELLAEEIARLKVQGQRMYGDFDLTSVPVPSAEDLRASYALFERWWQAEGVKDNPPSRMSTTACVNSILMHLGRYLRVTCHIMEFDKRRVVETYLTNDPPFVDKGVFDLVNASLTSQVVSDTDRERLRHYVEYLWPAMNAYLDISPWDGTP